MSITRDLPVATQRTIRRVAAYAEQAPAAARLPAHALIRMLRASLYMTQAQLAKRAGIAQSHLARIESGKVDPQLSTLTKVWGALFCDAVLLPRPRRGIDEVLEERIKEKARMNVARVAGTMALERQLPEDETLAALIRSEESRLRARPSSEIWAD